MVNKGNLFLIPTVIAAETQEEVIPSEVRTRLREINDFLVEDIRTARRYLSSLRIFDAIERLSFNVLNKDTKATELATLFQPIFSGRHLGVLSESGCPGIADPGALAVDFAHRHDVKVIPLVGPSSILLSLMASGLNGQQFAFRGYLPIKSPDAAKTIREFEKESRLKNQTQIFIETPYRNNVQLGYLLKNLASGTRLCIAVNITGQSETIRTRTVSEWRKDVPELPKEPAVFLFLS